MHPSSQCACSPFICSVQSANAGTCDGPVVVPAPLLDVVEVPRDGARHQQPEEQQQVGRARREGSDARRRPAAHVRRQPREEQHLRAGKGSSEESAPTDRAMDIQQSGRDGHDVMPLPFAQHW